ncbi:Zinc/cadmium resistance protein [Cytospora mali]|uniref:Zinc/cadmium resistance protein n=1 Tax=Cytospora mali TaxID=578113 RepID=A0A194W4C2_CYTMA|nr:Zinc/cadmium resistance protein [Valsa mali]
MAWSKSTRIGIMLGIDIAFFLIELISGFLVHSLALMADAFHMLNDIISLLVGLWAVNLASKATTDKYSYGWLRAEILGAFFNAVFLIALCVSIVLEAVTRFFEPPEITNPQLILIVGCLGLASNLVGFVVLGGHGHSHGNEHGENGHDHEHGEHGHSHDELDQAEQGRVGDDAEDEDSGPVLEYLPEVVVSKFKHKHSPSTGSKRISFDGSVQTPERTGSRTGQRGRHQPHDSTDESESTDDENALAEEPATENTPLIDKHGDGGNGKNVEPIARRSRRDSSLHHSHNHNKPKKPGQSSHGHSHGDMGMNAMILHVLGDALGNVGVIVTALIIWLTDWPGKYYADPSVSLFITLIILKSALPLTFATSKILLQATPEGIEVQDIREDIESLPGVITCHHVHIWQLSDSKVVASMHIQVSFAISEAGGKEYMVLAKRVRKCLHAYGIHSATIQPEFCTDDTHDHTEDGERQLGINTDGSTDLRACVGRGDATCLLECVDDCLDQGCCSVPAATTAAGSSTARSGSNSTHSVHSHGHSEGDGHNHH